VSGVLLTLAFAGATFVTTMGGGIAALRWPARLELLMAVAGGVVLGAAVFDLLPEAVDAAAESGVADLAPYACAIAGYFAFRVLERRLHRHDHSHGPGRMGVAGAAGFTVHSFFDGLAIGLGVHFNDATGIIVALAVIGHDFSDGLNTVSYLIAHGHGRKRQWRWLVADALAPILGALVAALLPVPDEVFPIALGFFAGVFVYAATANLLPRALKASTALVVPLAVAGCAVMFGISRFA
jgi:ZIP family zinc transporter